MRRKEVISVSMVANDPRGPFRREESWGQSPRNNHVGMEAREETAKEAKREKPDL